MIERIDFNSQTVLLSFYDLETDTKEAWWFSIRHLQHTKGKQHHIWAHINRLSKKLIEQLCKNFTNMLSLFLISFRF